MQKAKINDIKLFLTAIGLGSTIGVNIVMYATFLDAYFRGGWTTIYINAFGEMHFEIVFIPTMLCISIYAVYQAIMHWK